MIFPKNGKFRLKTEILKCLGIQPTYDMTRTHCNSRSGTEKGSGPSDPWIPIWFIIKVMNHDWHDLERCTLHWPSRFGLEQYRSSEARKSFLLEDIPWGKTRPIVARIEIGCPRIFNFQNCMLTHIEHLEIKSYIGCTGLEHWTLMKMIKAMVLVRSELNCWFFHGASRKMITFLRIVQLDHQEKPPTHFEG